MSSSLVQLPFLASANGQLIAPRDLRVSYADSGFVMGTTVSEQLRTFGGELFLLSEHLRRLADSLCVVETKLDVGHDQLAAHARALVAHNYRLLCGAGYENWDLGLGIFVTPGTNPAWRFAPCEGPLVGMYTYPLDFARWADQYETGVRLVTSRVRQIAPEHWPLTVKSRSRLHYFLAAQQAAQRQPGAIALLLNQDGSISETPTANIVFVGDGAKLVSPEKNRILPGISLGYVERLAKQFGWSLEFRAVVPEEIPKFSEIWLTSTPFCVLPVVQVDGLRIGDGVSGELFRRLISAWGLQVGLQIPDQARFCAATGQPSAIDRPDTRDNAGG